MKSREITKKQLFKLIQQTFHEMSLTLDNSEWKRLYAYYLELKKIYDDME